MKKPKIGCDVIHGADWGTLEAFATVNDKVICTVVVPGEAGREGAFEALVTSLVERFVVASKVST